MTTRSGPANGTGGTEPSLSVAAVARRMGVAPATLRTWDRRYGVGPSGHTTGRHRRYDRRDIARLETMQRALLRGASAAEAARYALDAPPQPQESEDPAGPDLPGESDDPDGAGGVAGPGRPVIAEGEFEPVPGRRPSAGIRGLRLPGTGPQARGLGRAVLAMDSYGAQSLLSDAIDALGLLSAWDDVIRPVMHALAQRWEHSGLGIELEHLLCECVLTSLLRATPPVPRPRNPRPVLLACVPEERHSLPLYALLASLALREIGARMLGPALPTEALVAATRRTAPAIVVLWAQLPRYADPRLADCLPRTRQRSRLLLAGPGWSLADVDPAQLLANALAPATDQIQQALHTPN